MLLTVKHTLKNLEGKNSPLHLPIYSIYIALPSVPEFWNFPLVWYSFVWRSSSNCLQSRSASYEFSLFSSCKNIFISPSSLKYFFVGYRILGWQLVLHLKSSVPLLSGLHKKSIVIWRIVPLYIWFVVSFWLLTRFFHCL